jgi:electron transfer flavoprotein beta subunit
MVGEGLGITEHFMAVDLLEVGDDDSLTIKERIEGAQYLVSRCQGPPAVLGWATGNLPEPPNSPQVGMANMRGIMPALQKAPAANVGSGDISFASVEVPATRRETKVVKDLDPEQIAKEIAEWIKG